VATPIEGKPSALKLTGKGIEVGALTLLTDRQQNERFWSELPTPDSLLHVETLPGSEVLVEADVSGKLYPAIVTRMSGAGRVLYMAFDETWRWRYKAADTWHQRVWNQLAQFVMPRPFAVRGEYLSVDTGAISYNPGDDVDVRIRLVGLDGKPNSSALAEALVWKDGKVVSTIKLNPDSQVPGIYRGRVSGLSGGDYEVSIQASGYNESALQARSEFVVLSDESVEFNELSANEDLLRQVAELSDGAFLREDEVGRLPELLEPLSSGKVVESETLLWQSYWWFMAILGLLTSEWILRKRAGLL
jgi:hypothetical protein